MLWPFKTGQQHVVPQHNVQTEKWTDAAGPGNESSSSCSGMVSAQALPSAPLLAAPQAQRMQEVGPPEHQPTVSAEAHLPTHLGKGLEE